MQEDSNNCGLWALITIFRRSKNYRDSVGKLTQDDLLKKRVHLFFFVSRLFGILITDKNGSMSENLMVHSVMM